MLGVLQ